MGLTMQTDRSIHLNVVIIQILLIQIHIKTTNESKQGFIK